MKSLITASILIIATMASLFCQDIGMSATELEKTFPRTYWHPDTGGIKNGVYYLKDESSHDTIYVCNYKNNVLHGSFTYYHTFYVLKGQFVNGKREGVWQLNEQNEYLESLNYNNDLANGTYTKYDIRFPKKVLLVKGNYTNGIKQGKWQVWRIDYKALSKNSKVVPAASDEQVPVITYTKTNKKPKTNLAAIAKYENGKVIEYKEWDFEGKRIEYEEKQKDPFQGHINSSKY